MLAESFEDTGFSVSVNRLESSGRDVVPVGRRRARQHSSKRGRARGSIDTTAKARDPTEFDALLISSGWTPDRLRLDNDIVLFVRGFVAMACNC